jgi:hypothetical protein
MNLRKGCAYVTLIGALGLPGCAPKPDPAAQSFSQEYKGQTKDGKPFSAEVYGTRFTDGRRTHVDSYNVKIGVEPNHIVANSTGFGDRDNDGIDELGNIKINCGERRSTTIVLNLRHDVHIFDYGQCPIPSLTDLEAQVNDIVKEAVEKSQAKK